MIHVDQLNSEQLEAYERNLFRPHERKVSIETLTLEGRPAGQLGLEHLEGQITVTQAAGDQVSRVLSLTAADRDRTLDLSPTSAGESVFFNRMLQVHDARHVPSLGWVDATPFTGPVRASRRRGNDVTLTCHSKERLAMGALWTPRTLPKGGRITSGIRSLLEDAGETHLDITDLTDRLPEKRALDRFETHWQHAFSLADALDRQLYYDGPGVARLRPWPEAVSFTFRPGDGGSVLTDPETVRDMSSVRNAALVLGKKAKGSKGRAEATVRADGVFSPQALARNGKPHYLAEKVEDTALRSDADCTRRGQRLINDSITSVVDATFEAAPIPHLDYGDMCALELEEGRVEFRLWDFTIPLVSGTTNVGQIRRYGRA